MAEDVWSTTWLRPLPFAMGDACRTERRTQSPVRPWRSPLFGKHWDSRPLPQGCSFWGSPISTLPQQGQCLLRLNRRLPASPTPAFTHEGSSRGEMPPTPEAGRRLSKLSQPIPERVQETAPISAERPGQHRTCLPNFWTQYRTLCDQQDAAQARVDKEQCEHITLARIRRLDADPRSGVAVVSVWAWSKYLSGVTHAARPPEPWPVWPPVLR